jgi:hypothetical protein
MAAFTTIKHPFRYLNVFLVTDSISTSDLLTYDLDVYEYFFMLEKYLLYNPHNY